MGVEKRHHIEKNRRKQELNGGSRGGGGTKKIFVNSSGVCTTDLCTPFLFILRSPQRFVAAALEMPAIFCRSQQFSLLLKNADFES